MTRNHAVLPAMLLLLTVCAMVGAPAGSTASENCSRGKSVFEFTRLPDGVKVKATKGAKQSSPTDITMKHCTHRALRGGLKFEYRHDSAPTGDFTIGYASRHACLCYSHGVIGGRVKGDKLRQLFHIAKGSLHRDPLKLTRESAKALNEALGREKHGPFRDGTIGRVTSAWAEF